MDRSSFRNIYNVCFYLISFIIKIPKIVESRERPSVRTAVSAHAPVFEHSETQYPHNGRVIYRASIIFINITFISYYLQVFIKGGIPSKRPKSFLWARIKKKKTITDKNTKI